MTQYEREVETPIGRIRIRVSDRGIEEVRFPGDGRRGDAGTGEHPLLERAAEELAEYFDGRRRSFSVPLALSGTPFEQDVYRELVAIPYGETRSYAAVAARVARPRAARAVGAANGKNPLSLFVPCHRVVGADGSLTGYAGGEESKRWLLAHERRVAARDPRMAPSNPPETPPISGSKSVRHRGQKR